MVQLSEHIKQVGTTTVKVKFAQDLVAAVNVVVVPQQDVQARVPSDTGEAVAGQITDIRYQVVRVSSREIRNRVMKGVEG